MHIQVIQIKPSIFRNQVEIKLDPDFIEYKSSKTDSKIILKENIDGFRYGAKWVSRFSFTVGRTYCIDIKSGNNIVQLRIKSLFGMWEKQIQNKYTLIINTLFSNYFSEYVNQFLSIYNAGADIEIGGLILSQNQIFLPKNHVNVRWENLVIKDYYKYFALSDKTKPKIQEKFHYLTDWNVAIIHFIVRKVLTGKGPAIGTAV